MQIQSFPVHYSSTVDHNYAKPSGEKSRDVRELYGFRAASGGFSSLSMCIKEGKLLIQDQYKLETFKQYRSIKKRTINRDGSYSKTSNPRW